MSCSTPGHRDAANNGDGAEIWKSSNLPPLVWPCALNPDAGGHIDFGSHDPIRVHSQMLPVISKYTGGRDIVSDIWDRIMGDLGDRDKGVARARKDGARRAKAHYQRKGEI